MPRKNEKSPDNQSAHTKHDENVFRTACAIFTENDLHELINVVYGGYAYKRSQADKLAGLIQYLSEESNRYSHPDLAGHAGRFSAFLDNFQSFLLSNFHAGPEIENGDVIFVFNTEETNSEMEAFLLEFQMVSLDIEKAYKAYLSAVAGHLGLA